MSTTPAELTRPAQHVSQADTLAQQPDGAKPGDSEKASPDGFDAVKRAKDREAAPVILGEDLPPYFRRRKNWATTRVLRKLLRKQSVAAIKEARIEKQLNELPIETDDAEIERLMDQIDQLGDESDTVPYLIVAALLRDENGEPPDVDAIKEALDVQEVAALAGEFSGGGEPNPTTATPSS